MNKPTLLDKVRGKLAGMTPKQLAHTASSLGYSYATVLRIRDEKTDPSFGKVQALAVFLGVAK